MNHIQLYLHCRKCIEEITEGRAGGENSPKEYQRIQAGWTKEGLQVWCTRHDLNIVHIDFEGTQHKADLCDGDFK